MTHVRVLERSFIDNRIVEPGEVIPFDGEIGSNLEWCEADGAPLRKVRGDGEKPA